MKGREACCLCMAICTQQVAVPAVLQKLVGMHILLDKIIPLS